MINQMVNKCDAVSIKSNELSPPTAEARIIRALKFVPLEADKLGGLGQIVFTRPSTTAVLCRDSMNNTHNNDCNNEKRRFDSTDLGRFASQSAPSSPKRQVFAVPASIPASVHRYSGGTFSITESDGRQRLRLCPSPPSYVSVSTPETSALKALIEQSRYRRSGETKFQANTAYDITTSTGVSSSSSSLTASQSKSKSKRNATNSLEKVSPDLTTKDVSFRPNITPRMNNIATQTVPVTVSAFDPSSTSCNHNNTSNIVNRSAGISVMNNPISQHLTTNGQVPFNGSFVPFIDSRHLTHLAAHSLMNTTSQASTGFNPLNLWYPARTLGINNNCTSNNQGVTATVGSFLPFPNIAVLEKNTCNSTTVAVSSTSSSAVTAATDTNTTTVTTTATADTNRNNNAANANDNNNNDDGSVSDDVAVNSGNLQSKFTLRDVMLGDEENPIATAASYASSLSRFVHIDQLQCSLKQKSEEISSNVICFAKRQLSAYGKMLASLTKSNIPAFRLTGPAARLLLLEYHLDPLEVKSTGPRNALLKCDVLQYIASHKLSKVPADRGPSAAVQPEVKFSKRLSRSFTDMPIVQLMKEAADQYSIQNIQFLIHFAPSIFSFVIRACLLALKKVPEVNVLASGDDVFTSPSVNIGINVISNDLFKMVVIRDANLMSAHEINLKRKELEEKVHSGTLIDDDCQHPTFSIINLADMHVTKCAEVLLPPQCALLSYGEVYQTVSDENVRCYRVRATLSYNNAVIRDEAALEWLNSFGNFLQHPILLI
ncbi:Pyruvate dehydrogenase protein X component [Trichinella spiralis]|uniref:Pyruvate dehydrogenase protein X component n=1 Tax=Trichinella spiralis TaxID=6334 RepID=A0ABR3KD44_TRISP